MGAYSGLMRTGRLTDAGAFFCLEEVVAVFSVIYFIAADFVFARREQKDHFVQFHGVPLVIEAIADAAHEVDNTKRSGAIYHFEIDNNC